MKRNPHHTRVLCRLSAPPWSRGAAPCRAPPSVIRGCDEPYPGRPPFGRSRSSHRRLYSADRLRRRVRGIGHDTVRNRGGDCARNSAVDRSGRRGCGSEAPCFPAVRQGRSGGLTSDGYAATRPGETGRPSEGGPANPRGEEGERARRAPRVGPQGRNRSGAAGSPRTAGPLSAAHAGAAGPGVSRSASPDVPGAAGSGSTGTRSSTRSCTCTCTCTCTAGNHDRPRRSRARRATGPDPSEAASHRLTTARSPVPPVEKEEQPCSPPLLPSPARSSPR